LVTRGNTAAGAKADAEAARPASTTALLSILLHGFAIAMKKMSQTWIYAHSFIYFVFCFHLPPFVSRREVKVELPESGDED